MSDWISVMLQYGGQWDIQFASRESIQQFITGLFMDTWPHVHSKHWATFHIGGGSGTKMRDPACQKYIIPFLCKVLVLITALQKDQNLLKGIWNFSLFFITWSSNLIYTVFSRSVRPCHPPGLLTVTLPSGMMNVDLMPSQGVIFKVGTSSLPPHPGALFIAWCL